MLTVFRWRQFWFSLLRGAGFFVVLLILVSCAFLPPLGSFLNSATVGQLIAQNPLTFLGAVANSYPLLVVLASFKILLVSFGICAVLQALSGALPFVARALACMFFFVACVVRMTLLYPSVAESWWLTRQVPQFGNFTLVLSSLPQTDPLRGFLNWLPFWCLALMFVANIILLVRFLVLQRERFNVVKRGIMVEDLERESRRSAMGAAAMVLALGGALLALTRVSGSFKINISGEDSGQFKPHLFLITIDSLRTDRLLQKEFANVMPFLQSKIDEAALASPMLVGVPQSLPSWVEVASCRFSPGNRVRTQYPGKRERLGASVPGVTPQVRLGRLGRVEGEPDTLFSAAQKAGYTTLFVSDDRRGVFSRYPFGAERILGPDSNLNAQVENAIFTLLAPLQGVLIHPKLHRMLENLLTTPGFADPRLLGQTVASELNSSTPFGRPVFLTAFFTASHFPYPVPSPYHRLFRNTQTVGSRELTVAHYDGALRAIDDTLRSLWEELETSGWLANAVVVVMGNHGENLFEGELGNGHGGGVSGEYATQTPLVIWTTGRAEESIQLSQDNALVRTVDIAPTLARRAQFPFEASHCDGIPLLDVNDKRQRFSSEAAYQETDLWPLSGNQTPENQERVNYPSLPKLLSLDPDMNFEFELQSELASAVISVKERAWITDKYRLVARTSRIGTQFSLYNRKLDLASSFDLLRSTSDRSEADAVATELTRQLNEYLISQGVEVVRNSEGRFFYSENVSR